MSNRWAVNQGKGTEIHTPKTQPKDQKPSFWKARETCDTLGCTVMCCTPQHAEALQVSGKVSKAWLSRPETAGSREALASRTL